MRIQDSVMHDSDGEWLVQHVAACETVRGENFWPFQRWHAWGRMV